MSLKFNTPEQYFEAIAAEYTAVEQARSEVDKRDVSIQEALAAVDILVAEKEADQGKADAALERLQQMYTELGDLLEGNLNDDPEEEATEAEEGDDEPEVAFNDDLEPIEIEPSEAEVEPDEADTFQGQHDSNTPGEGSDSSDNDAPTTSESGSDSETESEASESTETEGTEAPTTSDEVEAEVVPDSPNPFFDAKRKFEDLAVEDVTHLSHTSGNWKYEPNSDMALLTIDGKKKTMEGFAITSEKENPRESGLYSVTAKLPEVIGGMVLSPLTLRAAEGDDEWNYEVTKRGIEINLHNGRGGFNLHLIEGDFSRKRVKLTFGRFEAQMMFHIEDVTNPNFTKTLYQETWATEDLFDHAEGRPQPENLTWPEVPMYPQSSAWVYDQDKWIGPWEGGNATYQMHLSEYEFVRV